MRDYGRTGRMGSASQETVGAWSTLSSRQNAGAASLSGFARMAFTPTCPDWSGRRWSGRPGRFCGERVRVAFHVLRQSPLPAPPAKG